MILILLLWAAATYSDATAPFAIAARWPLAALFAALGVQWWLKSTRKTAYLGRYGMAVMALAVLCGVSAIYSRFPQYTLGRAVGLMFVLSFCVLGAGHFMGRWGDFRLVFRYFVWFAVASAVVLILSYQGENSVHAGDQRFQANESLKATGAGILVVTIVPILTWCAFHGRGFQRTGAGVLILFLLFLLILTKSRGPIGTLLLISPIIYVTVFRVNRSWTAILFLVGIATAGIGLQFSDLMSSQLRMDSEDVSSGRFERWSTLASKGAERLGTGYGFGTSRFDHHMDVQISFSGQLVGHDSVFPARFAHNEHVGLFYDLGILGVGLFVATILPVLAAGWGLMRYPSSPDRDMLLLLWTSWLARLADTVSHDAYLTVGNPACWLFWLTGCVVYKGSKIFVYRTQQAGRSNARPEIGAGDGRADFRMYQAGRSGVAAHTV